MRNRILSLCIAASMGCMPQLASACACGCGVFEVGTASMLPTSPGGMVWMEYDFMNQGMNWSGSKVAPEANNSDIRLRSDFYTAGLQYMFNRSWGTMIEVPYTNRYFRTTDDSGNFASFQHGALGDVRLKGIYSGFSSDMSSGITFGFKLPTGDHTYTGFDRDTDIGTGSTDLLLGAYHQGMITADNVWSWFINGQLDQPFLVSGQYRPGDEVDVATGVYYDAGPVAGVGKLYPLLQIIGSQRWHDSGANSNPDNSGYSRVLISPGVEYDVSSIRLYGDVELPIYQHVNGNQLVAPVLFKVVAGYSF